jgi:hypothetical protein
MSWCRDVAKEDRKKELKLVRDALYICKLDEAPDHFTEGRMESYTSLLIVCSLCTIDVFEVCTLEADLSAIPKYLFRCRTNSLEQEFYEVIYQIAMTPTSASILFNLEFNGVSYGSVQAKY